MLPLTSYHKHPELIVSRGEQNIKLWTHKKTNIPVQQLFEQEEIQMAKQGLSSKEISDGMYQYHLKKARYTYL